MVIIQKRSGQLGNQLFTIAHFAAAAIEHGFKVCYPCFNYPLEEFPNINSNNHLTVRQSGTQVNRFVHGSFKLLRNLFPNSPVHRCLLADDLPFVNIGSEEFVLHARKKLVACEGFGFRDGDDVVKHHELLSNIFHLSKSTRDKTDSFICGHNLKGNVIRVGFHIRRTDYRTYRDGLYYYDNATWVAWIDQARALLHSAERPFAGIIFSDEDASALIGSHNDLVCGPGGMYEDLCLLSKCHYIIGPPSTYSGWASFSGRVPLQYMTGSKMLVEYGRFNVVQW